MTTKTNTIPKARKDEKPEEYRERLLAQFNGNKSATIRALAADGMARGDIARLLGIKYQFVRNVLVRPYKGKK